MIQANTSFRKKRVALGQDNTVSIPLESVVSLGRDALIVAEEVKTLMLPPTE